MRILKASVLVVAVTAFAAPAFAGAGKTYYVGCGGYDQSAQTAQTVTTPTGPQTVTQSVTQTADQQK